MQLSKKYIDNIIHNEIPDKTTNPKLYNVVSKFNVHGPYGNANPKCPCMVDDKCSKKFPKSFNEVTTFDNNGYPIYGRMDNGRYQ